MAKKPTTKAPVGPATADALIRRIRATVERAGWRLSHHEIDGEQIRLHVDPAEQVEEPGE